MELRKLCGAGNADAGGVRSLTETSSSTAWREVYENRLCRDSDFYSELLVLLTRLLSVVTDRTGYFMVWLKGLTFIHSIPTFGIEDLHAYVFPDISSYWNDW
jgi:hypothetical protein